MIPKELVRFKELRKPITILTAWDSISSSIVEDAGADVVLVGDSLAMFVHGHTTTLPITLEQMLHHAQAVGRGFKNPVDKQPLVVCDLPFLSYQCGEDKAVSAAGTLLKNSCASAVKLEGAEREVLTVINRLIRMGIPVMGHLGLTPQSVNNLGYKRQAEDPISQNKLIDQAIQLENAGCFAIVLEHVPDNIAKNLREKLIIPVIGIGAGDHCDGQVRVTADLLGLTDKQPPFTKPLIEGKELFSHTLKQWVKQQHL
ncbi:MULTISPECIES: 3-methyl-2-oxobutanoate hydroxymethyltransferase [Prochlorococcus]|uniref:3-methyl-2-oxobutanoate hydroxymethyltransferase n=1 Tax=Prochlorococcus TaxID=1218 RepID=UPI00053385B4|nr:MULTISPECIES: 3-methyl-2-oxobutanoate hydroxymethyltransferase [Prochlorococcus]KGG11974.1 3-methyl-2-oxobutanoate hydroxymethyltransferase [Prochlorococcus sp. MIT 0601]